MSEASAMSKLLRKPIAAELRLGTQEPIPIWLAPLSFNQEVHVSATSREAYRVMVDSGAEEEDATEGAARAKSFMTVFYAVRNGSSDDSPMLFVDQREVVAVGMDEVLRLMAIYIERFKLTEDDLGNSLRERTSTSKTLSPSPASSPEQPPSVAHS